jgi:hypothetical protein
MNNSILESVPQKIKNSKLKESAKVLKKSERRGTPRIKLKIGQFLTCPLIDGRHL